MASFLVLARWPLAATADGRHGPEPAELLVARAGRDLIIGPSRRGALYRGGVRLYLVQHGQAKPENEDPQRPLTGQGADDVARVATRAVGQLAVRVSRVVHSGKTRARQTAELWGGLLDADVEEADALLPNDDPTIWAERLGPETADLMLVGHLPHLARLAGMLLTGVSGHSVIAFRPGGLVGLERADTGWLVWVVLPPEGA
jgi:phosphohistidine phosphatase